MTGPIKIIRDAVKVKNAFLMHDNTKYTLQHYDTIILEVENNEVLTIKPNISVSSSRAINQAFEFLGINKTAKDFKNSELAQWMN